MLHTLSRSPWQCDIDTLLSMLREGDDLLLSKIQPVRCRTIHIYFFQ